MDKTIGVECFVLKTEDNEGSYTFHIPTQLEADQYSTLCDRHNAELGRPYCQRPIFVTSIRPGHSSHSMFVTYDHCKTPLNESHAISHLVECHNFVAR